MRVLRKARQVNFEESLMTGFLKPDFCSLFDVLKTSKVITLPFSRKAERANGTTSGDWY